jgi:hypothetical protein
MKWGRISSLLAALLFIAGVPIGARAATASVTLLPGPLAITDAPATLTYLPVTAPDDTQTFAATFTLGVVDATGSHAGWHIAANLGPVLDRFGSAVPVRASVVDDASVRTAAGRAPVSTLAYPLPFRGGDAIFRAAVRTGAGRASLSFDTELSFPTGIVENNQYTATLTVSVLSGP